MSILAIHAEHHNDRDRLSWWFWVSSSCCKHSVFSSAEMDASPLVGKGHEDDGPFDNRCCLSYFFSTQSYWHTSLKICQPGLLRLNQQPSFRWKITLSEFAAATWWLVMFCYFGKVRHHGMDNILVLIAVRAYCCAWAWFAKLHIKFNLHDR